MRGVLADRRHQLDIEEHSAQSRTSREATGEKFGVRRPTFGSTESLPLVAE
jgi:hypothetical protein